MIYVYHVALAVTVFLVIPNVAGVTLTDPGESSTLADDSELSMAIARDPCNGQVRGILSDLSPLSTPLRMQRGKAWGLASEVLFNRGIPDAATHVGVGPSGKPEIRLSRFFAGSEYRVDLERLYYHDYFWRDKAIPRLDGLGHGELVHKRDLYTDHEKTVSTVYNEFRRVNRTQDGFFLGLHDQH